MATYPEVSALTHSTKCVLQASEWATLFSATGRNTVRGVDDADGVFISLVVDRKHMNGCVAGGFDGFYTYFAVDKFSWGSTWAHFGAQKSFADLHKLANRVVTLERDVATAKAEAATAG